MEDRLINLIKTGKGEVKDLVEAEKQLGVYREASSETLQGQINYYNNQVALSTLVINLYERDLRRPAALVETGQVTVTVETEDVETQYNAA